MKNKLLSILIIFTLIIPLVAIFCNKSNAAETETKTKTNYIFVGDTRTVHMIGRNYEGCNDPVTGVAQEKFEGNIKASYAFTNAWYRTFAPKDEEKNAIYEKIIDSELSNAKREEITLKWNGSQDTEESSTIQYQTKVIVWLGLTDLANPNTDPSKRANTYVKKYKEIANKYKDAEIYIISVTDVNDSEQYRSSLKAVTNERIGAFDDALKRLIEKANLSNLKYIDICSEVDEGGAISENPENVKKGYIYSPDTYQKISNLIYDRVNNLSFVGTSIAMETLDVDLTDVKIKRYFYPEGYLVQKSDTELEKGKDYKQYISKKELLTGKKSTIKYITSKEYSYNKFKYYEVVYIDENGKERNGYVNVDVFKRANKQQKNNSESSSTENKTEESTNKNITEGTAEIVTATVDFSKNNKTFYPASYLNIKSANELEKTNAKDVTTVKLTDKATIKCYKNYSYKFGTGSVYLTEYNGEIGYINKNALKNQDVKNSTEKITTIKTDFTKLGKYYFYSPMYLRVKAGTNELTAVSEFKDKKTLLEKEQSITLFTDTTYKKNNVEFYRAIYNGNIGYVNTKILEKAKSNSTTTSSDTKKTNTTNNSTKNNNTVNNNTTSLEDLVSGNSSTTNTSSSSTKTNTSSNSTNTNTSSTEKKETHKVDFSKATVKTHRFYPDTYLKVKSGNALGHITGSKDTPTLLEGTKEVTFYLPNKYTLTTKTVKTELYKVEIKENGKTLTGYINANFYNSKYFAD